MAEGADTPDRQLEMCAPSVSDQQNVSSSAVLATSVAELPVASMLDHPATSADRLA
jgi:hypothetical protein